MVSKAKHGEVVSLAQSPFRTAWRRNKKKRTPNFFALPAESEVAAATPYLQDDRRGPRSVPFLQTSKTFSHPMYGFAAKER